MKETVSGCFFLNTVYIHLYTFMFSSAKTESGDLHDNPYAVGGTGNAYDKPWTMEERRYSTMTIYDDIDEWRAGYAELQSVKPEEQATSSDAPASNDDPIFSDAPEPPPARPHEYLELISVS